MIVCAPRKKNQQHKHTFSSSATATAPRTIAGAFSSSSSSCMMTSPLVDPLPSSPTSSSSGASLASSASFASFASNNSRSSARNFLSNNVTAATASFGAISSTHAQYKAPPRVIRSTGSSRVDTYEASRSFRSGG